MTARIVLRFRDLVTSEGDTINEHRSIIRSHGAAWWGWWMRPYETLPRELFGQVLDQIDAEHTPSDAYLLNTGANKLYSCTIADIRVAAEGSTIASPEPAKTPLYYHQSRYPAWFHLTTITDLAFEDLVWYYHSIPTLPSDRASLAGFVGTRVKDVRDLRTYDTTLWVIDEHNREPGPQQLVRP